MKVSWGRCIVAALAAEIGAYIVWGVVLIAVGVLFMNPTQTRWFAYLFGQSVGIFSGFVLCIFAARWAADKFEDAIKSGLVVGALCTAINALIALVTVGTFPPILLAGSLGRFFGGAVGGWLVSRRRSDR